ncbi:AAA family ATPase [Raineyella fluvialis]|uniref:Nuclease SbcCD subunit C n=1 Tax=Raineyella fluvialis TaxID=2662261 RepID=A0A5Q2F936_9ACTN|nr:SMC family ATPase [Raineyella fluvialis]QGF23339.1 AAA family ATPase [Raineyella fluvialis]
MQLHRLTLRGIGPFPDECVIDLDALGVGGLFLIEGPTGSGKSTLLDAITFALYGSLANPEASDERLHSAHAGPEVEPYVDLVFSTAAGDYRIWRQPRYERPKQRGTGTTTQNQQVRLWRLSPGDLEAVLAGGQAGRLLSTRAQEVGAEIPALTGLTRDQFTQTVLLPQGKFATFLRARPDDRRAVLQQVFGTDVYDRVQKRLIEGARDLRRSLDRVRQDIGKAVAVYGSTVSAEPQIVAALEVAAVEGRPELAATLDADAARFSAEVARTTAVVRAAEAEETKARSGLERAEKLAEALRRRADLLARDADLTARADAVAALRERLALSRAAAAVVPLVVPAERSRAALADALATAERVAVRVEGGVGTDEELLRGADEDEATSADCSRAVGELEVWARTEAGLPARREDLANRRRALDEQQQRLAGQRDELDARPADDRELEETLARLRQDAGDAEAAAADTRRARVAREAAAEAQLLEGKVEEAARQARLLLDVQRAAGERALQRQLDRFAGMAGEMAAELRADEPCLVCGSTTHPAPAALEATHVSAEDVRAAEEDRDRAVAAVNAHQQAVTGLTSRLAARRAEAGGLDLTAATEALRVAEQHERQVRARLADLTARETALRKFRERTEQLTAAVTRDELAQDRAEQSWARERDTVDADTARCAELRGDQASVEVRVQTLRTLARAAQQRATAARAVIRARAEERDARTRLEDALAESPFRDPPAARAARLDREAEERADAQVRAYDKERDTVDAGLAELAGLTGDEDPRLDECRLADQEARLAARAATSAADAAATLAADVARARAGIEEARAAYAREAAQGAALLRVSDLAQAGSQSRIRTELATWVLVRRFEEVIAAANDRLQVMSDGRYLLERVDDEAGQRSTKLGLGLQVVDQLTDRPRSPGTLSGGETFYVSLALALGLADIVRAEAGGVDLDTLFIDEGFGSLDPSALENVMIVLDGLRAGGRTVGVISHVADMKDRIPERISVRRRADGSSTLAVTA